MKTTEEIWEQRLAENGIVKIDKTYIWKESLPYYHLKRNEKLFNGCLFALICANVLFVIFLFWIAQNVVIR